MTKWESAKSISTAFPDVQSLSGKLTHQPFPWNTGVTWRNDWQALHLLRLGDRADVFSKVNWVSFLFQGKSWPVTYCQWPNLSFRAKIRILETYIFHCEPDRSSAFKDFSDEVGGDMNECFLKLYHNCVKIWNSFTMWTSIFQLTNAWCHKNIHGLKMHSKYKTNLSGWPSGLRCQPQGTRPTHNFECNRVWKVHWYGLDFISQLTFNHP